MNVCYQLTSVAVKPRASSPVPHHFPTSSSSEVARVDAEQCQLVGGEVAEVGESAEPESCQDRQLAGQ